ncbi:MAG: hypothetical protein WCC04_06110 [Terriglobales bacterium]
MSSPQKAQRKGRFLALPQGVATYLVRHDANGKELSSTEIHVASNVTVNPYQGIDTRHIHALSRFEIKLREEIERMP